MTLKTAMAADLSRVFLRTTEFADTITYGGVSISAIVEYGGSGGNAAKRAVITVRVANVANPAYRDAVVIGGVTWTVYKDEDTGAYIEGDGYAWRIPIIRDERPKV